MPIAAIEECAHINQLALSSTLTLTTTTVDNVGNVTASVPSFPAKRPCSPATPGTETAPHKIRPNLSPATVRLAGGTAGDALPQTATAATAIALPA